MEVINRKSKQVIINGGRATTRFYASVERNRIYFTAMAARICEMKVGLYVHFLNEGEDWKFYINDDEDGFKLTHITSKGGFHVSNMGLVNMILNSTGFKKSKKFEIERTDIVHDKCEVFSLNPKNKFP